MTYTIDYNALYEKVDELVSQVADHEYDEEGNSLFDGLVIHSNEKPRIIAFIDAGLNTLVQRLGGIADIDNENNLIVLDHPDFNEAMTQNVTAAINQYLVNYACAYWFDRVNKDKVEQFLNIAKGAIDNAAVLAKTRKKPVFIKEETDDEDNG